MTKLQQNKVKMLLTMIREILKVSCKGYVFEDVHQTNSYLNKRANKLRMRNGRTQ